MKKYILSALVTTLAILITVHSFADVKVNPNVIWQKFITDFSGDWSDIQPTTDGGYIVGGATTSKDIAELDAWLIKLDKNGKIKWEKTYGGVGRDEIWSICSTKDGGYLAGGRTKSKNSKNLVGWLIKLDKNGKIKWEKTIDDNGYNNFKSIKPTKNGGYIAVGWNEDKGWIIKLDSKGNIVWNNMYGGNFYHDLFAVHSAIDSGYIAAGSSINPKGKIKRQGWIVKIDNNGNKEWEKTFGGVLFNCIQSTKDGGYLAVGDKTRKGGFVVKLNKNGDKEWEKTFGGKSFSSSIQSNSGAGYILVGYYAKRVTRESDAWIVNLDQKGNKEWEYIFINRGSSEGFSDIHQTNDGKYIVLGIKRDKINGLSAWIVKLRDLTF